MQLASEPSGQAARDRVATLLVNQTLGLGQFLLPLNDLVPALRHNHTEEQGMQSNEKHSADFWISLHALQNTLHAQCVSSGWSGGSSGEGSGASVVAEHLRF